MKDLVHQEMSIGFPDGWTDRTEVVFAGPVREGRSPTVTIKRITLQFEMSLAEFVKFQIQAAEVLLGVKPIDVMEEGPTTLAGIPAHIRVYRMRFAGKWCVQRQYYALRGLSAYVLTTTSADEHYTDDLPVFEEILARFQITPPAP
jgi:hypothetical protein